MEESCAEVDEIFFIAGNILRESYMKFLHCTPLPVSTFVVNLSEIFCWVYNKLHCFLRLAEDVVFAALKVSVKESCHLIMQCCSLEDEPFCALVAKHPVSHFILYYI